jgi:hypothetical protein
MRRVEEGKVILEGGCFHICISKPRLKARYLEEEREIEDCPEFRCHELFLFFFSECIYYVEKYSPNVLRCSFFMLKYKYNN